jgi:hypothetical protein
VIPALLATALQVSPLTTKWKRPQFATIPVWIGIGVVTPSPTVVEVDIEVGAPGLDDEAVVVVVVIEVVGGAEELSVGLQGSCILSCILSPNYDFGVANGYSALQALLFSLAKIHLRILGSLLAYLEYTYSTYSRLLGD